MCGRNIILILIFLTLSFFCCENLFKSDNDEVKDPRKYTWTVDTLSYPESMQTTMYTIWGSSPKDVYVVGHNDQPGPGTMFHFDGTSWSTTGFHAAEGGPVAGPVTLYDIHGFSSDDVWFAGLSRDTEIVPPYTTTYYTLCVHYNGKNWEEIGMRKPNSVMAAVWGDTPANMWCCGAKVYHLENGDWREIPVPLPSQRIGFCQIKGLAPDDIYMTGIRKDVIDPIDSTAYDLYHYDGKSWEVIDSTYWGYADGHYPHFGSYLAVIDGELYSADGGAFKLVENEWIQIHSDLTICRIAGSSADNIFVCGGLGTIYHFNGDDWQKLTPVPEFSNFVSGVWTDGKEVFFIGYGVSETYIFHGK